MKQIKQVINNNNMSQPHKEYTRKKSTKNLIICKLD